MTIRTLPRRPHAPHTPSLWEHATKFINPLIVGILRSPFHGLLSGRLLVIAVTGRRTGTLYHVPVGYRQELGEILIFSHQDRAWWRNLKGGADVMLRLRGFDVHAVGTVVEDRTAVIRAAQDTFHLSSARAAAFAKGKVLLDLRLSALPHLDGF